MESRNNRKGQAPILNSAKLTQEYYSAQMLHREALTSQKLIGSFSLTHQMILKTIFTELVELAVVQKAVVKRLCSYSNQKWAS